MIQLLMAAAMGLQGASGLWSAGQQARWQEAGQYRRLASAQLAQAAYDEAADTGGALVRQAQTAARGCSTSTRTSPNGTPMRRLQQGNVQEGRSRDRTAAIAQQGAFFAGGQYRSQLWFALSRLAGRARRRARWSADHQAAAQNEWAGQLMLAQSVAQQRADTYDAAMIGIEDAFRWPVAVRRRASASGAINAMTAQKQGGRVSSHPVRHGDELHQARHEREVRR